MNLYLQWYNNVLNQSEILTLSRKRMTDLPSLPQYCLPTGNPFIYWNSVLAKCYQGPMCRFAQMGARTPDFWQGWVLMGAHRRQSITQAH
jgi:hypothetical protein